MLRQCKPATLTLVRAGRSAAPKMREGGAVRRQPRLVLDAQHQRAQGAVGRLCPASGAAFSAAWTKLKAGQAGAAGLRCRARPACSQSQSLQTAQSRPEHR
jgi:hypothetical protein